MSKRKVAIKGRCNIDHKGSPNPGLHHNYNNIYNHHRRHEQDAHQNNDYIVYIYLRIHHLCNGQLTME